MAGWLRRVVQAIVTPDPHEESQSPQDSQLCNACHGRKNVTVRDPETGKRETVACQSCGGKGRVPIA